MSDIESLRSFLVAVAEGGDAGSVPAVLHRIARKALRRAPAGTSLTAEDVAHSFVVRQLEDRRSGGRAVAWASLEARRLRAAVALGCRRVVVEQTEGWAERKQLREHVAAVLRGGLPPCGELPGDIGEGGRYRRELVAQAISWLLARDDAPAREAGALTAALRDLYLPSWRAPGDDAPEPAADDDLEGEVGSRLDGQRLARELTRGLSPADADVLGMRLAGRGFAEIAARHGRSAAGVFGQSRRAEAAAARVLRGASREAARWALHLLEAQAARLAGPSPRAAGRPRATGARCRRDACARRPARSTGSGA